MILLILLCAEGIPQLLQLIQEHLIGVILAAEQRGVLTAAICTALHRRICRFTVFDDVHIIKWQTGLRTDPAEVRQCAGMLSGGKQGFSQRGIRECFIPKGFQCFRNVHIHLPIPSDLRHRQGLILVMTALILKVVIIDALPESVDRVVKINAVISGL